MMTATKRRMCLLVVGLAAAPVLSAQTRAPAPVLVELFTSEGCSSCPPADALLAEVNGTKSAEGQLIIGLSEHVSYWNSLGWRDPFSAELFTERQDAYSAHLGGEGPYTPQMVVNGRTAFVGSDRPTLERTLAAEDTRANLDIHIQTAEIIDGSVSFSFSARGTPAHGAFQVMAAVVDDLDQSQVLRGENSGRALRHVFVARALVPVGVLESDGQKTATLPLPPSVVRSPQGHHLIVFVQREGLGPVLGVDLKAL